MNSGALAGLRFGGKERRPIDPLPDAYGDRFLSINVEAALPRAGLAQRSDYRYPVRRWARPSRTGRRACCSAKDVVLGLTRPLAKCTGPFSSPPHAAHGRSRIGPKKAWAMLPVV
jgi:hypothetical protein